MTEDTHLKVLKLLQDNPRITQRQLARELGFSLGKVNYCLKALMQKGLLKVNNFRNSQNKSVYLYLLTPNGVEEKTKVTIRFMQYKMDEYETLKQEIKVLQREAARAGLSEAYKQGVD